MHNFVSLSLPPPILFTLFQLVCSDWGFVLWEPLMIFHIMEQEPAVTAPVCFTLTCSFADLSCVYESSHTASLELTLHRTICEFLKILPVSRSTERWMVNGLHLYSALLSVVWHFTLHSVIHTFTHSHTHRGKTRAMFRRQCNVQMAEITGEIKRSTGWERREKRHMTWIWGNENERLVETGKRVLGKAILSLWKKSRAW